MENRVGWIDAVRGAGIICVILGHMQIPEVADKIIFSFHMPLFFFLSGYLYKNNLDMNWVVKKIDGLIVPYVLYGTITLVSSYVLSDGHFEYWIRSGMLGNGIGLTWFFMCLFMAELTGATVVHRLKRHTTTVTRVQFIVLISVLATVAYANEKLSMGSIMMSRSFLGATCFWLGGFAFSQFAPIETWNNKKLLPLLLIVPLLFCNEKIDMAWGHLGFPLLTYPVAFAFICLVIIFVRSAAPDNCILKYIGRHSMLFMMWHSIVPPITKWIASFALGIDVNSTIETKIIQRGVNLILMLVMVWCIDKWVVCLTGRWRPFSEIKRWTETAKRN